MDGFWWKVDKNLRYYARAAVRLGRGLRWDWAMPCVREPVFVVGCSRAGTTLVYKTFSESRQLASLQRETHDLWMQLHPLSERNWRSHALRATDANQHDRDFISRYFYSHTGSLRFADKNNQNGLCIPYLQALFPDALFVYVKRSPGDNLNSLIEGWARADEFATWSDELPAVVAVENGQYTRWCFFLAEGWRHYLESAVEEVCAFQYEAMNRAILDAQALVAAERWTEIRYEDLLADPVEGFRQAFEAIGLEFDGHLREHCETVLARPYNAFSEIRLDKWRDGRHAAQIERVLPRLAETATRMGY